MYGGFYDVPPAVHHLFRGAIFVRIRPDKTREESTVANHESYPTTNQGLVMCIKIHGKHTGITFF